MGIKKLSTITPTHYITDKKGKKIAVFRGGIQDQNKYARKTPFEKEIDRNLGNANYKPKKPV
jgi:ABC-type amino acid transport substrate-binding protein